MASASADAMAIGSSNASALSSSAVPSWQRRLHQQVLARNAAELGPSQSLFSSYAGLYERVRALEAVEQERRRLAADNDTLSSRVRDLERAAADSSVRSSRETELERRKDELQERLQRYIEKENEYYRGLAELREWKESSNAAFARAERAETELRRRESELALLKKEYTALRDENELLRTQVAETDHYKLDLNETLSKMVAAKLRISALEDEVGELRQQLQHAQQLLADRRGSAEGDRSLLSVRRDAGGGHADPALGSSAAGSLLEGSTGRVGASSAEPAPYPTKATRVVEDAHGAASLQALCVTEITKQLFTAGTDKVIRLWNPQNGETVKQFSSGGLVMSLDSTSHYLFAGCADRVARFWDTDSLRVLELAGHTEKIVAGCLSSTAQHAFTTSSDSTIKLWDVRRRAAMRTLLCQSTSNDITVDGQTIYSAHYNGTIVLWDRRTSNRTCEVKAHQRVATCVRISVDGQLCVSLGKDNVVSVRDTRMVARSLRQIAPPDLSVTMNLARLAISADGRVCAVGTSHGEVLLLTLDEESDRVSGNPLLRNLNVGGHEKEKAVYGVAWGHSVGAPLFTLGDDRRIVFWQ